MARAIISQAAARASGLGAEEIQDFIFVNGCFWHGHNVSLTPSPSPEGEVNNYQLSEEEDMQMPMAAEE